MSEEEIAKVRERHLKINDLVRSTGSEGIVKVFDEVFDELDVIKYKVAELEKKLSTPPAAENP